MQKKEKQMLLSCVYGDDKDLAKYAEKKLSENGISVRKKKEAKNRIKDYVIFELYNSSDPFLIMKAKELTVKYYNRFLYYIMEKQFSDYIAKYSEDLYQCGVVGLLKSLIHYDGTFAITTYSHLYIVHEMTGFIYYLQNIPSPHYAKIQRKIISAEKYLTWNGFPATDEAIAKKTGLSMKSVIKGRTLIQMNNAKPIDLYSQDYLDTLLNTDNIIENTAFNNMDYEFLFSIIMELPCDQYRILYLKLFEEYTFEEIAKTMKWKSGKVSKSYYNGIEYLKEQMKYYFQK